jgi:hypothetical protein
MEHAHGPAAVVLQRGEEGRVVLLLNAAQYGEVQLLVVLLPVEDAAKILHRGVLQIRSPACR